MNNESPRAVGAVIVAYHPDMKALEALVESYLLQVQYLVVVDNTPGGSGIAEAITQKFQLIELRENLGIAAALNRGIDCLMGLGCNHFVLSDQDSVPPRDFVSTLLSAFLRLEQQGQRVATVGAVFVDPRTGHATGFAHDGWRGNGHTLRADSSGLVPASYVITSGSLVSRSAFEEVGPMAEGLFIDYVDMEWCFRATAKGYAVYGEPAAVMRHTLGDRAVTFWLFGRRQKGMHSPVRVYFQNRNILLLCRMSHVAMHWKFWALAKRPASIVLYLLVANERMRYLRSALKGLLDGLRGRDGNVDGRF